MFINNYYDNNKEESLLTRISAGIMFFRDRKGKFKSTSGSRRCRKLAEVRKQKVACQTELDSEEKGSIQPPIDECMTEDFDSNDGRIDSVYHDHSYSKTQRTLPDISHIERDITFNNEFKLEPLDEGRYIVELGSLAKYLDDGCKNCQGDIRLSSAAGVNVRGLGGWIHIVCLHCHHDNKVPLSKTHRREPKSRGSGVFDINTKLAAAMIDTGLGDAAISSLFACLNIKPPSKKTLKERESEIGEKLEEYAHSSVDLALAEEAACSMDVGELETPEHSLTSDSTTAKRPSIPKISASVDGTWQRRGAGRSYNSLSGVATMIGVRSGKVVGFGIRSKRCRKCAVAKRLNNKPKAHVCRKNWSGSSKAMEPDILVEMIKNVNAKNVTVGTVIGDDDTTGIKRARQAFGDDLQKASDKNHVRKNIGKQLWAIKPKFRELSTMVINAITKNFNYMLSQNQQNEDGITKGLKAVVGHIFGKHGFCQDSWCGYSKNPNAFRHNNLPYGKDLTDEKLEAALSKIFIENLLPQASKLANLASSQSNESFNNSLASKAPKYRHYSESSSLTYRVCATVSQKNEGSTYVSNLYSAAGLSPGLHTLRQKAKIDKERKLSSVKSKTVQQKRRRLQLKAERAGSDMSHEVKEGPTYQSNIDLVEPDADIEMIPDVTQPLSDTLDAKGKPLVVFDLETSGLERTSCITQIAAFCEGDVFSCYVTPSKNITDGASDATGLTFDGEQLFHKGLPVDSTSIHSALTGFIDFLRSQSPSPLIIGHNIKRFDLPVLYNTMKPLKMWSNFCESCTGFIDTLPVFKEMHPSRKSYKQVDLVQDICGLGYAAHDAVEDVKYLAKLVVLIPSDILQRFAFSPEEVLIDMDSSRAKASFLPLIKAKALSNSMAMKIAKSGLSLGHLKLAYNRAGVDGLAAVLGENVGGAKRVRVTKNKRVIAKLSDFLKNCTKS